MFTVNICVVYVVTLLGSYLLATASIKETNALL